MTHYIDSKNENASWLLARQLKACMGNHLPPWSEIIFLCIGSDRITGDCLGPFVGQFLCSRPKTDFMVYGTIFSPVHALNLSSTTSMLRRTHPHALTIAVDASLGQKKHLGCLTVRNGSLHPGAGIQKNLPPVGDIAITGVVNLSGIMEQLSLQTTRLSTVISMAETIAEGILLLFPS